VSVEARLQCKTYLPYAACDSTRDKKEEKRNNFYQRRVSSAQYKLLAPGNRAEKYKLMYYEDNKGCPWRPPMLHFLISICMYCNCTHIRTIGGHRYCIQYRLLCCCYRVKEKYMLGRYRYCTVILFSSRYLLPAKSICPTCKQTIDIFMQNMRAALPTNRKT
jgi:hypothetical protein